MAALRGPARIAYRAFRALPGPVRGVGETVLRLRAELEVRAQPTMGEASVRLLVGPTNTAGQGRQWARAVQERLHNVDARNLAVQGRSAVSAMAFGQDIWLSRTAQLRGLRVHRERVLGNGEGPGVTHVLSESGRPLLGGFHTGSVLDDLPDLASRGIRTAVVFHGSDIRDPDEHAARYPHSPFREAGGPGEEYADRLREAAARGRAVARALDGPVFVSTPDLLDVVPDAVWLPLVVDVDRFTWPVPALRGPRPVVLHAPSNPRLKGTETIERALLALHEAGSITYRRLSGVAHADMPGFIGEADVVVDQVVLGNPGVLLAETMAAGRLAVAHLAPDVRERMRVADPGGEDPPVLEATPETVEEVVAAVAADPPAYAPLAARGPAWAGRNHVGSRAALVLEGWLTPLPGA